VAVVVAVVADRASRAVHADEIFERTPRHRLGRQQRRVAGMPARPAPPPVGQRRNVRRHPDYATTVSGLKTNTKNKILCTPVGGGTRHYNINNNNNIIWVPIIYPPEQYPAPFPNWFCGENFGTPTVSQVYRSRVRAR